MKLLHVGQPSLCPASFWGYPKTTATGIVGAYSELVYLSTVLGGWIADRLLGMERTALYGYDKGDARCVGGFALFYLGINLGAFVGPLITGLLQSRVGFRYTFGAAAIGMALGLGQYVAFRHNLGAHGRTVPNPLPRSAVGWVAGAVAVVAAIMAMFAISELLISPIGLSVTTKLAPEAFRAQMMALYFFSVGLGTSMSGVLARYYDSAHEFVDFGIIGGVAIFAGVIAFAIAPWISRLMEGVH